jgi:hypothetical protein
MPGKNTIRQREFKARMYAAGYKQKMVWVPRGPGEKTSRAKFLKRLDELTKGWNSATLSELFTVFLAVIEPKKEDLRKKGR